MFTLYQHLAICSANAWRLHEGIRHMEVTYYLFLVVPRLNNYVLSGIAWLNERASVWRLLRWSLPSHTMHHMNVLCEGK